MIERLVIRGLGVIDDAAIDFAPGLTVITGETGAGKTMVLTGFALLAGAKADSSLVRRGAAQASVDGEWMLARDGAVAARLREAGADLDDDGTRVVFARTVAAEGRSRAHAGGRSVPAAVLADACAGLIAVHGQAEQMRLRAPETQRELLDRFAGAECAALLAQYRDAFGAWRRALSDLTSLRSDRDARDREASMLALAVREIDEVAPQPSEDLELDRLAAVLGHAGSLLTDVTAAHDDLVGTDDDDRNSAIAQLVDAQHALERAVAVDPSLAPQLEQVRALIRSIPDLAAELASYSSSLDADPARQAWVEERRSQLAGLKRRYGSSVDEVIAWLEQARATVAEVAGDDDRVVELEASVARLASELRSAASALTAVRAAAAQRLSLAVTEELHHLAMPDAVTDVAVHSVEAIEEFTSNGADSVELRLRPHTGSEFRPVTRGASGGELSRVMLAIEVALAGTDPVPTFIFDEVDAGIGGRAAVEVGRRLARLARTSQVIVVTHLPQVAAFADRQVVVTKDASGAVTASSTRTVDGRDRVDELVRMLSGLEATEAGAAHAEELLAVAAAERDAAASLAHTSDGATGGDGADVTGHRPRVTRSARAQR